MLVILSSPSQATSVCSIDVCDYICEHFHVWGGIFSLLISVMVPLAFLVITIGYLLSVNFPILDAVMYDGRHILGSSMMFLCDSFGGMWGSFPVVHAYSRFAYGFREILSTLIERFKWLWWKFLHAINISACLTTHTHLQSSCFLMNRWRLYIEVFAWQWQAWTSESRYLPSVHLWPCERSKFMRNTFVLWLACNS